MSNEMVVTASQHVGARKPGLALHRAEEIDERAMRHPTPLGRPVEPDVKITYAGSSGPPGADAGSSEDRPSSACPYPA